MNAPAKLVLRGGELELVGPMSIITVSRLPVLTLPWYEEHVADTPAAAVLMGKNGRSEGEIVGVCIVGRPLARMLQDGYTAEVLRCCTDGTYNACSMLYGAAWRAVRALGYRRLVTYTLPEEGGSSLLASGFKLLGEAGGGSWSREGRPRVDLHPTQEKLRWEKAA